MGRGPPSVTVRGLRGVSIEGGACFAGNGVEKPGLGARKDGGPGYKLGRGLGEENDKLGGRERVSVCQFRKKKKDGWWGGGN